MNSEDRISELFDTYTSQKDDEVLSFGEFRKEGIGSQERYIKYLLDDAEYGDKLLDRILGHGHAIECHANMSAECQLERTINEMRPVSFFENKEDARYFIDTGIYNNARKIAHWLADTRCKEALALCTSLNEFVGKGIDCDFNEVETKSITVVLHKDFTRNNPLFFSITTAYPSINIDKEMRKKIPIEELLDVKRNIKKTGKNLTEKAEPIIESMKSTFSKGFWRLKIKGYDCEYYETPFKRINVNFNIGEKSFIVRFKEFDVPRLYLQQSDSNHVQIHEPKKYGKDFQKIYDEIINSFNTPISQINHKDSVQHKNDNIHKNDNDFEH